MVVSLVAFGMGFGLATNTVMGKTGINLDLPSNFPLQSVNDKGAEMTIGQNIDGLTVMARMKLDPQMKHWDTNEYGETMKDLLSMSIKDFKILKKGKLLIKNLAFEEIQATGKQTSVGESIFFYMTFIVHNGKTISIVASSPVKKLDKNRPEIAKIIGSITIK